MWQTKKHIQKNLKKRSLDTNMECLIMVLGNRVQGQTYPEKAKNMVIWNEFEFAGFQEWKNTRVLYYIEQ